MNDYMIFVDLSCDIDISYAKENNIGFVPMQYMIDENEFTAEYLESDERMKNFYDKMRSGAITKTTQITPYKYTEFFKNYCEKKTDILYFTLSSGLSKTYESALVARTALLEDYPDAKIEIIDSLAATGGIGVLAGMAVENKKSGMDVTENARVMREATKKIRHWFFVDDLTWLKRGGRVSAATAFFAGALNIKPVLEINREGKLETIAKMHGANKAVSYLCEMFEKEWDGVTKTVYVPNADCPETAERVKEALLKKHPELDVRITSLCIIIGSHTGPNMCAICHMGK